jgi:signal recognition particle receptor subunit beta
MVFFNWATMQMAAKIVYYGPGLCGKTSNLSYIYAKTAPSSRGEMVSLETESDRTLFFDLLPIEVGTIGGFKTRLQLYTVPGQVFYNTTRKLVLKGVDGVVFVADSQRPMREANNESFAGLKENLEELGLDITEIPMVLQYNKRDLPTILTVEELNEDLNPDGEFPYYESSAINGDGVFETLKEITKLTLKKLRKRMASPPEEVAPPITSTRISEAQEPPKKERPRTISAAALARAAEEGVDSGGGMPTAGEEEYPADAGSDHPEGGFPAPALESQAAPEAMSEEAHGDVAVATQAMPEIELEEDSSLEVESLAESDIKPESDPDIEVGEVFPENGDAEIVEYDAEAEQLEMAAALSGDAEAVLAQPSEDLDDGPTRVYDSDADVLAPPEGSLEGIQEAEVLEVEESAEPDGEVLETEIIEEEPEELDVLVEFDQTDPDMDTSTPPPVKRVQVSNQMDILAELDGLRKQATMSAKSASNGARGSDLDLDALLSTGGVKERRTLQTHVEHSLNSDIFKNMTGLQLAIRIQNEDGETIHTLDPVSCTVEEAKSLKGLSLQLTLDLENTQ